MTPVPGGPEGHMQARVAFDGPIGAVFDHNTTTQDVTFKATNTAVVVFDKDHNVVEAYPVDPSNAEAALVDDGKSLVHLVKRAELPMVTLNPGRF